MAKLVALVLPLLIIAGLAYAGAPNGERAKELIYLLKQDCGSCHGLTLKGGLGPALLPERLAGLEERDIADVILNGRPGTTMPPWKFAIDRGEALWLARMLKTGVK